MMKLQIIHVRKRDNTECSNVNIVTVAAAGIQAGHSTIIEYHLDCSV